MKFDFRINLKFVFISLVVALIVVPILFNYLFLWESGEARGETSDWFTLYGNIIGGLLGGFFTYLALLLTFKEQKETKMEEMRPKIDIPHQTIEFIDSGDTFIFKRILIELNNIGGSIAKNIECSYSLPNYDDVLSSLENAKNHLKIDFIRATTFQAGDTIDIFEQRKKSVHLIVRDNEGNQKLSLGSVYNKYDSEFLGTCIPLILNYEAKTQFSFEPNVSYWIDYIAQNRYYTAGKFNENELFNFNLEVNYSSDEYGDFSDTFILEWEFIGIWAEESQTKFKYVLKSKKVNKQAS